MSIDPQGDQPLVYSVADACRALGGISRSRLYQLMDSGALASVTQGRRRFVRREALVAFLDGLETRGGAA